MRRRKSQTQYFFRVDLKRRNWDAEGVALLGHQTLRDLHELITDAQQANQLFSFRFSGNIAAESKKPIREAESEQRIKVTSYDSDTASAVRLDQLNLEVGQTFECIFQLGADDRHTKIRVDAIHE